MKTSCNVEWFSNIEQKDRYLSLPLSTFIVRASIAQLRMYDRLTVHSSVPIEHISQSAGEGVHNLGLGSELMTFDPGTCTREGPLSCLACSDKGLNSSEDMSLRIRSNEEVTTHRRRGTQYYQIYIKSQTSGTKQH